MMRNAAVWLCLREKTLFQMDAIHLAVFFPSAELIAKESELRMKRKKLFGIY